MEKEDIRTNRVKKINYIQREGNNIELIKKLIKGKEIIIFGAGEAGRRVYINLNREIKYFVDNDPQKNGKLLLNKKIVSPHKLLAEDKNKIVIIIASMYSKEISQQLSQMGFRGNENFFIATIPKKVEQSTFLLNPNLKIQTGTDKGKLIFDIENKKVYRGYYSRETKNISRILERCQIESQLLNKYIIPTEISNYKIPPFDLILNHIYIYPFTEIDDWSPLMVYDACLKTIEIMEKLNDVGLTLHDPNTKNITYYNNNFIWSDFGSICPIEDGVNGIKKLVNDQNMEDLSFLQKIILFHRKKFNLTGEFNYISPVYGYFDENSRKEYEELINNLNAVYRENKLNNKHYIQDSLSLIKEYIMHHEIKVDEYLYDYYLRIIKKNWYVELKEIIMNFIVRHNFNSVSIIDFGGKFEKKVFFLFPNLKQHKISTTVIQDDNEVNDIIYKITKQMDLICYPIVTNKYNTWIHSPDNSHNFEKKVVNNLIVCLNFVHEMIFYRQRTFEDVVNILKKLTKKYLIIEFLTKHNSLIKKILNESYYWYSEENFLKELEKKFIIDTTFNLDDGKKLFICQLKF